MNVTTVADQTLVAKIEALLARPAYFKEVLDCGAAFANREILRAWSDTRERRSLQRDKFGRYLLGEADA